jgi:hypothetical protein
MELYWDICRAFLCVCVWDSNAQIVWHGEVETEGIFVPMSACLCLCLCVSVCECLCVFVLLREGELLFLKTRGVGMSFSLSSLGHGVQLKCLFYRTPTCTID